MVYVFMEILCIPRNAARGFLCRFFGGMCLTALIDKIIPEAQNPHEVRSDASVKELKISANIQNINLCAPGFTAAAITIHNFPEGFATFAAAASDIKLGITIAIAAIHNIPKAYLYLFPYTRLRKIRKSVSILLLVGACGTCRRAFRLADTCAVSYPQLRIVMGAVAGIMIYILTNCADRARIRGRVYRNSRHSRGHGCNGRQFKPALKTVLTKMIIAVYLIIHIYV